jgi:hypothetical protein
MPIAGLRSLSIGGGVPFFTFFTLGAMVRSVSLCLNVVFMAVNDSFHTRTPGRDTDELLFIRAHSTNSKIQIRTQYQKLHTVLLVPVLSRERVPGKSNNYRYGILSKSGAEHHSVLRVRPSHGLMSSSGPSTRVSLAFVRVRSRRSRELIESRIRLFLCSRLLTCSFRRASQTCLSNVYSRLYILC